MFLSEWREFPSAHCLAGNETWWQLKSRCCWKSRASLTCFQAWFHPGRAKDLSAPRYIYVRIWVMMAMASPCSGNYWVRSEKVSKEEGGVFRSYVSITVMIHIVVQCGRRSPKVRCNLLLHTSDSVGRGRWLLTFPNILHIEPWRKNSFWSSELTMERASSSETSVIIHHNARRRNPAQRTLQAD